MELAILVLVALVVAISTGAARAIIGVRFVREMRANAAVEQADGEHPASELHEPMPLLRTSPRTGPRRSSDLEDRRIDPAKH